MFVIIKVCLKTKKRTRFNNNEYKTKYKAFKDIKYLNAVLESFTKVTHELEIIEI